MEEYQKRVITEKEELDEKIEKLKKFIGNPTFKNVPAIERSLLEQQLNFMSRYSNILANRITNFHNNI